MLRFLRKYETSLAEVTYLLEYKKNAEEAVVVLDADTLIQNYTSWIDEKNRQILLPSIV